MAAVLHFCSHFVFLFFFSPPFAISYKASCRENFLLALLDPLHLTSLGTHREDSVSKKKKKKEPWPDQLCMKKMDEITYSASRSLVGKDPRAQPAVTNGNGEASVTLLDRLSITRCVWELPDAQPAQAAELLSAQLPGTFIVSRSRTAGAPTLTLQVQENEKAAVCHFPMKEESSAIYLEGSQLRFRDVLELVSFHLVSRDILPCPLRLPHAFQLPSRHELDAVAALGMKFWTMPLKSGCGLTPAQADDSLPGPRGDRPESSQPVCSIQVTSEEGALCIINPLFLVVHSDSSWLDLQWAGADRAAGQEAPGRFQMAQQKWHPRRKGPWRPWLTWSLRSKRRRWEKVAL
ncbi:hypothetical protein JRQ81_011422 [Phrynocephalus forsythii]|uniref:SH2 domain-containing protein n=1 Tax=Phrynocephalus forsythii TaxID=171643 RepID=A0A9Q0X922_9SAUR|nr:hypothetical protein JRQ81_011422 [Phrynocephalus forsythii]